MTYNDRDARLRQGSGPRSGSSRPHGQGARGRVPSQGAYHGPRGTRQRPAGPRGSSGPGYPLRARSINFQSGRARRMSANRRLLILGALALVILVLIVVGISSCVRGCSAEQQSAETNPVDERVAAGEALLNILPTVQDTQPVHVGSFRGFDVEVSLEAFGKHVLTLKGALEHHVELGEDARGNISRIENALTALDKKLGALNTRLSDLQRQVENAREELEKPFPQENELREKSARLVELNAELDMENNTEPQEAEKPSVLKKLKEPIPLYEPKPHQPKSNGIKSRG